MDTKQGMRSKGLATVTLEQLQSIEWAGPLKRGNGVGYPDYINGPLPIQTCPLCSRERGTPHADWCWLAAALAPAPEPAPPATDAGLVERAYNILGDLSLPLGTRVDAAYEVLHRALAAAPPRPEQDVIDLPDRSPLRALLRETAAALWDMQMEPDCWCHSPGSPEGHTDACKQAQAVSKKLDAAGVQHWPAVAPRVPERDTLDVVEGQCPHCGERGDTHANDCRRWICDHCGHGRDAHRDGTASRLVKDGSFQPCKAESAHGYLSRMFKGYAPQCEPLPDLLGVCTQVDNLIAGMRPERDTPGLVEVVAEFQRAHADYQRAKHEDVGQEFAWAARKAARDAVLAYPLPASPQAKED